MNFKSCNKLLVATALTCTSTLANGYGRVSYCLAEDKDTSIGRKRIISQFAAKGERPHMEDYHVAAEEESFFAVFDGHGGRDVSRYASQAILPALTQALKEDTPAVALKKSFKQISDEILSSDKYLLQGSCAVAIYLTSTSIISANIGDSRAVLSRAGQAYSLTVDHKPNSPDELERITSLGGEVSWDGLTGPDRNPVPGMGTYRINHCLAVSRALGDKQMRPFITSEADIEEYQVSSTDEFCVVACDGLWDVMTSEECVDFVHQILNGHVAALEEGGNGDTMRKTNKSLNEWRAEYDEDSEVVRAVLNNRKERMAQYLVEESLRRGSDDNVTAIVVWLK